MHTTSLLNEATLQGRTHTHTHGFTKEATDIYQLLTLLLCLFIDSSHVSPPSTLISQLIFESERNKERCCKEVREGHTEWQPMCRINQFYQIQRPISKSATGTHGTDLHQQNQPVIHLPLSIPKLMPLYPQLLKNQKMDFRMRDTKAV